MSFSIAFLATSRSASLVKRRSTSSKDSSFWYCLMIAFLGSVRISTSVSSVRPCMAKMIGILPTNSGIIPYFLMSSTVTSFRMSLRLSSESFSSALKPIEVCLRRRCLMISSRSGKAPPQINRMFLVLTVVMGTIAFLELAPTGTSTSAPSSSFSIPCCTLSPLTSRLVVFFFLAILSISSMKMIPDSARSTSLSAAASSLETTLSMSSPM